MVMLFPSFFFLLLFLYLLTAIDLQGYVRIDGKDSLL